MSQHLLNEDSSSIYSNLWLKAPPFPVGKIAIRRNSSPHGPLAILAGGEVQSDDSTALSADSTALSAWEAQNKRRMALIYKNVKNTISVEEKQELGILQSIANQRIRQLAPLPLQELEAFKNELKQRGIVIAD